MFDWLKRFFGSQPSQVTSGTGNSHRGKTSKPLSVDLQQSRRRSKSLEELITEFSLNSHRDALLKTARNSIQLTALPKAIDAFRPGESRLGGWPDLPPGIQWPIWQDKPLGFICQIDLGAVQTLDINHLLPKSGFLYFFYDAEQSVWGFDPKDRGAWRVYYHDGGVESLKRHNPPKGLTSNGIYTPCELSFSKRTDLPDSGSYDAEQLRLDKKEGAQYDLLVEALNEDVGVYNHLLGHSQNVQNDMQLEAQLVFNGLYCGDSSGYEDERRKELEPGAADWQLLLQIDSDDNAGMMWGDVGRIYYWIREQDLQKKNFENVWFSFQCC